MKVISVFVLFFSMMFSLEVYLNTLEQDIQESSPIIVTNTTNNYTTWLNPFEF